MPRGFDPSSQGSSSRREIRDSVKTSSIIYGICTASLLLSSSGALAEDWPHWRGLSRNGVTGESSRWEAGSWPPGDATWIASVEAGSSAVAVAKGKLYSLGWDREKSEDVVSCLDAKTGRLIWRQSYPCPEYGRRSEGDKGLYFGPSASPSFDAKTGLLYTLSTDGDLNCWDTRQQGKRVWSVNFYETYDVGQRPLVGSRRLRDYGYTASPLIHGDWIVAEVGDEDGNLMAFDKRTGLRKWASESKDPAGHTGGLVPMTVEKIPCVAVLTIRNLLVARLDTGHEGETLAEFPWVTDFANSIATPVVQGNSVIVTSEYNQYSIARIDVTRSGAKEVWKQPYASGVCSPVIHKGHVYWCWRGVYCLEFATGRPLWRGRVFGDTASCLVTKDDRLVVWADRGELVLAETAERSPKKFTELARKRSVFQKDVWPHIVLSEGRFYCKDSDGNLQCFELR